MDKFQNIETVARLVVKWRNGLLSEDERVLLEEWKAASPVNAEMLERWADGAALMREYGERTVVDTHADMAAIRRRIDAYNAGRRRKFRRRIVAVCSVAAIAAAVLVFDPAGIFDSGGRITIVADQVPGITIDDGKRYTLDNAVLINGDDGLAVEREGRTERLFDTGGQAADIGSYATLDVPRGYTYQFALADGTQVWLNAGSRLRYPLSFGEHAREVELSGEAFFDVAHDPQRPFRVLSAEHAVEVLGTEFNVKAYPQDGAVYTTLVDGSVLVSTDAGRTELGPGMQAIAEGGTLNVKEVNAANIASWRDGMLVLEEQTIGDIMSVLARWYDFRVEYGDPGLKGIVMKGVMPFYDDLEKVLGVLSMTGNGDIDFVVGRGKVTIKRR